MRRWLDMLCPPRVDEKVLRDTSVETFLSLMTPSVVPVTRPDTVILLPFSEPVVRSAIHEAKYRGSERAFVFLSSVLASYLRNHSDETPSLCIVPVPLGKARREERGFNQVEEIARRATREFRIDIDTTLLTRTRETASQISLPRREREENMHDAFKATRHANPDTTYIVIDDVLTTGATLQSAIEALKQSGATRLIPLALAH